MAHGHGIMSQALEVSLFPIKTSFTSIICVSNDVQKLSSRKSSSKDLQIANLENELQEEKEARKTERFIWFLALLTAFDLMGFRELSGLGIAGITIFEFILIIAFARVCGFDGIERIIQNSSDLASMVARDRLTSSRKTDQFQEALKEHAPSRPKIEGGDQG